jgi:transposase
VLQRRWHPQGLRQVVQLCRRIGTQKGDCVAIDGSKFKAVNNRNRNFTKDKIASRVAHLEADVDRCITEMVRIDRQEEGEARAGKVECLPRRYGRIWQEFARLREMDQALANARDGQISLTDPDAGSMATSAPHSGLVGYNVKRAVDTKTHLIVAHEVTDQGFVREQRSPIAISDNGYFSGLEILA